MSAASSKILSSSDVRLSHAPVRVGEVQPSGGASGSQKRDDVHNHEPEVALEHDANGNVSTISIRCRCGEEITIACDYPNAA